MSELRSRRLPVPIAQAWVLIVEDTLENLASLERMLIFSGVPAQNCVYKATGTGVVQFVETVEPLDLILLDLILPDDDGYDIIRELRRRSQFDRTRIVAITGRASADEMRKAQAAGFDGFIGKPLEPNRFREQLRRILDDEPVWEYR